MNDEDFELNSFVMTIFFRACINMIITNYYHYHWHWFYCRTLFTFIYLLFSNYFCKYRCLRCTVSILTLTLHFDDKNNE